MPDTQDEATQKLQGANVELQKVGTEIDSLLAKIEALENAPQEGIKQELQDAIDAVVAQGKALDDKVADTALGRKKKKG
jgi:hypothetical protein